MAGSTVVFLFFQNWLYKKLVGISNVVFLGVKNWFYKELVLFLIVSRMVL